MNVTETKLANLYIAESASISDQRGTFSRYFCRQTLQAILQARQIVQINHSSTASVGAVRGMHTQYPPHAEVKMVRCLAGRVWDVAVDLRHDSPTWLQWHAEELSATNNRMMIIPEGFAHGFQVLEPASQLLYLHTAYYTPTAELGIRYDDPALAIDWPLPVSDLSQRDKSHALIGQDFQGIVL